ncbi:MAG: type II secretion system F family protein [Chthoniobacteraceae bacterium]
MPQFRYVARNSQGSLVEGVIDGNDRSAALAQLDKDRFTPIKVTAVAAGAADKQPAKKSNGSAVAVQTMSYSHQYLFTEQLGHLLGAGITLDESLGILERRLKQPKLQSLSKSLHQSLIDGRSLSQALRDYPKIFTPLYVNLVSAGEASGSLGDIMMRLVRYLADVKSLRDRVQQALLYPAVLVVAGVGLVIVFTTVMLPKLTDFFKQTGQQLPTATQMLLNVNHLLTGYWWLMILAAFGIGAGIQSFRSTPAGLYAWDSMLLKIPGYGHITRYRFYAQFARTLGTLVDNGVTLLRAIELLQDISGNEFIRQQMIEVHKTVIDGASLSNSLRGKGVFPEMFLDMMSVGEQTGRFGETMQMIADVYERELDKQVKMTSALIPPAVMVVIAAIVGTVVYGILVAVFNLTTGLRAHH